LSTRIGIVGLGAIGGWIGARLALAGHAVSALARGSTLDALNTGLRIREGDDDRTARIEASAEPSELGPQDLLIIGVKAPALAGAAALAQPMIGANTLILPMLNGVPWWFMPGDPLRSVDPDGGIAANLPQDRVIGCVVHAACRRIDPAAVEVVHADKLILGEPEGGSGERVERLATLFESAGIPAEVSDDVRRAIWYKLWGNATINPLSALTRATADKLIAEPQLRAFMLEAMEELASIGAAVGCPIKESGEDRMAVTARLGSFKTSMLQDVEAGRPIELEALLGAPREIAQRVGIPTPKLDLLYAEARLLGESLSLL
jgi:2-dehydropantoate 2-reductase